MNILLLGSTGRTGKYVLEYLLKNGHSVNALVRNKSKIKIHSDKLAVFQGDTTDKITLLTAANNCEVIISVLNISRTSDFPWAKLRTPPNFLSETMGNIINVAKEIKIRKVIVCSAWGVHETKKEIPAWFRWIMDNSNVGVAYTDHERSEVLLKNSGLNYTIVRPVGLTNSIKPRDIQAILNNTTKPKLVISRANTANFITQLLEDKTYSKQAVTISNK